MIAAFLLAVALSPCQDALAAGAAAAREIEGLYHHRNGAIVLETRLSQALADGEFDDVCRDPEAFAAAFSARANLIGGGDVVRMWPAGPDFDDPVANRLAVGPSVNWGLTSMGAAPHGVGRVRAIDFYPIAQSETRIIEGLIRLQPARAVVVTLDAAYGGDTETALALFAALAPRAASKVWLNLETRHDYAPIPLTAPPSWPRLDDGLEFFVVVGPETGQAGRALATLLRLHAGALVLGRTTREAGGWAYETFDIGPGFVLEMATGAYRLAGSTGWPSEQVRPDVITVSAVDAIERAELLAARAVGAD